MQHVVEKLGVSERRACQVMEQPRSTHRYRTTRPSKDEALMKCIKELAEQNPRYGYRRVWACLRREGWEVNRKHVQRLWREAGLKVSVKRSRRIRVRLSGGECAKRRAEYPNHVWSYDFVIDQTEDGRRLKLMPVMDEYTRECLLIEIGRNLTSSDVVRALARLFVERGEPGFIRSDNGPEFIAQAVKCWLGDSDVKTLYIEPGSPWENPYSESFHSRFRDELLDREVFYNLLEARVMVEDYRMHYNTKRPHSALEYRTPAEFALECHLKSLDYPVR